MTRRAFAVSMGAVLAAFRAGAQDAATVDGKLMIAAGKPVPGATVFLDDHGRQCHLQTKSNNAGLYAFENLAAGHYTLWCELPDYGCIMYPNIALESGQHIHRDFQFSTRDRGCET